MSNVLFPALPIKITSWMFQGLNDLTIPGRSSLNTGNVGNFIDQYIKQNLAIPNLSSVVDLSSLGIEIKSKEYSTKTDWSIGSMTLKDILNTPYIDSSIYQKMQALLLVKTNDDFRVIKDVTLVYFDIDEVQTLIQDSYEEARSQLQRRVRQYAETVAYQIKNGNLNAVLDKIEFKNYEKFSADHGKFEFMDGTSFQFRISVKQMKFLIHTANSYQNSNFEFA